MEGYIPSFKTPYLMSLLSPDPIPEVIIAIGYLRLNVYPSDCHSHVQGLP